MLALCQEWVPRAFILMYTVLDLNAKLSCFASVYGHQYLSDLGIAHETSWDMWQNIMALAIIGIGVEFLAYVQLRRVKKRK